MHGAAGQCNKCRCGLTVINRSRKKIWENEMVNHNIFAFRAFSMTISMTEIGAISYIDAELLLYVSDYPSY